MEIPILIAGKEFYDLTADEQSEVCVLGAIIMEPHILPVVEGIVSPEDFTIDDARKCFVAAKKLRDENMPVDVVTVYRASGVSSLVIAAMTDHYVSIATAEIYARAVREASARRKLAELMHTAAADAAQGRLEADEAIARLHAIRQEDAACIRGMKQIVKDVMLDFEIRQKNPGALLGISTGYPDLDKLTNGWRRGELNVLAARPAMGKSALALNFAWHAIKADRRVMFFSLEMSANALATRLFAMGGVSASRLKSGAFIESDWRSLGRSADLLVKEKLSIEDGSSLTAEKLSARVRAVHSVTPVDLVIVDYLQLMQSQTSGDKNREREVAEISRYLKNLTRDLDIPVVALSQLNRGVETRNNKRPGMADLRESGAIEQDADVIMMLYRDEVYNPDTPDKGVAEVIVCKIRDGQVGTATLEFRGEYQRFDSKGGRP